MFVKTRRPIIGLLACALLAVGMCGTAHAGADESSGKAERFISTLHTQTGPVLLSGAKARLNLHSGYSFLPAAQAQRVLTEFWGNPPDNDVLGMILPDSDPHVLLKSESWAVVVEYVEDGHVADEDASKINYQDMLADMQKANREANPERLKQGYPAVELLGWAEPPHYDSATHKLYWARNVKFTNASGGDEDHSLNYAIRVLGRNGYLSLNAVAPIGELAQVRADMPAVLDMAEFDDGQRYADYNASTDKLAAYGIGALVAGGLAAKAGLLAKLGLMLLALKKFVFIAIAAIGGAVAKFFKRKRA